MRLDADQLRRLATPNVIARSAAPPRSSAPRSEARDASVPGLWCVRLTLPLPPSNNNLVRPVLVAMKQGKPVMTLAKTRDAREWVADAVRRIAPQLPAEPHRGPVAWWATFYVRTIARDCTNGVKQLEDVLTGRVWHDDSQVVQAHQQKRITELEERVIIEVRPALADPETTKRILKSKACGGPG